MSEKPEPTPMVLTLQGSWGEVPDGFVWAAVVVNGVRYEPVGYVNGKE